MRTSFTGALTALILSAGMAQAEAPRTIIVMDGSGSMWGKIDGRPKLEIARETVTTVLGAVPADQEIGLIAYGHRTKGDCSDIELIVPPAKGSAREIEERVNTMRFLGKTPLSDAVRQAAEALRYGEEAATVVLVTDGLETCNADPCALGRELEAAGLDFTAHVIGFGLTKAEGAKVACLAENTGGRYIEASNAKALRDALAETVTAQAPPPAPKAALPDATLSAPDSAVAGSLIEIGWTGPDAVHDYIQILDAKGERVAETAVADGNPALLRLPFTPGPFTLVYTFDSHFPIASRPITLTEGKVTLNAPDRAQVRSEVSVAWTGPDAAYDNIQLVRQSDQDRVSYDYVNAGNPIVFTMPDEPGIYEFLYVFGDREVIARRPITVVLEKVEVAPAPIGVETTSASAPQDGSSLTPQDQVPITLQADTGSTGLNIVWSAIPVPGQNLPPEAWAMNDGTPDPVEAEFFPGEYDVLGDAGDTVFAGRIKVVAGAANRFVVPYSSARSPAGEDTPLADDGLVTLRLTSVPAEGPIRWFADPIGGQDTLAVASTGPVEGPWETRVDPGLWLITGKSAASAGISHMALQQLAPSSKPIDIAVAPPAYSAREAVEIDGLERACDAPQPCLHRDAATGLGLLLPSGWGMETPLVMETAAGVAARYPTTVFLPLRPDRNETMIALNTRQWDATLGPCTDIAIGVLCRTDPMSEADLQAYRILLATLDVAPR